MARSWTSNEVADVEKYVQDFSGRILITLCILGPKEAGKEAVLDRLRWQTFRENTFHPHGDDETWVERPIGSKNVALEVRRLALPYGVFDHPPGYLSPYLLLRHIESSMFVYDVGDRASFEAVQRYHANFVLERSLERHLDARTACLLCKTTLCRARRAPYFGLTWVVANKVDRPESEWAISNQEGETFAASIGAEFIALSAKTGQGHEKGMLMDMIMRILRRRTQALSEGHDQGPNLSDSPWAGAEIKNVRFWY